jgi:osmotically-inducible protein OsmY
MLLPSAAIFYLQAHPRKRDKMINFYKDGVEKGNAQTADYINEGNPNNQEAPKGLKETAEKILAASSDKQSAQVVRQALNDDQALSSVVDNIHVAVKEGSITLSGQVSTQQQSNLATNTALAFVGVEKLKDEVINNMVVEEKKS